MTPLPPGQEVSRWLTLGGRDGEGDKTARVGLCVRLIERKMEKRRGERERGGGRERRRGEIRKRVSERETLFCIDEIEE